MDSDDNQGGEQQLRERIASLLRANEQALKNPVAQEEAAKLKQAASRLDQLLHASAEADQQALRNAATKLDQMLTDIRKGKDVSEGLKRRERPV